MYAENFKKFKMLSGFSSISLASELEQRVFVFYMVFVDKQIQSPICVLATGSASVAAASAEQKDVAGKAQF